MPLPTPPSWVPLFVYAASMPDVDVGDNATVLLDADNEVQPDALLRRTVDGASTVSPKDYIVGPPELIVEIAGTSAAYDLHDKKHVYRRNGVQEYAIWVLYDNDLLWFRLVEGRICAGFSRTKPASFAAHPSPACGSTCPPCWPGIYPPYSNPCKTGWPTNPTPLLFKRNPVQGG